MKGTLYIQRDKGRQLEKPEPIECVIDMGASGTILASVASSVRACMHRVRVNTIGADGMLISGIEDYARNILHYQEWWFVPIIEGE